MSVSVSHSHPQCCPNPSTCTLSYREHLVGFGLSAMAIPTRTVNRTPGHKDEPITQTITREKRWERDMAAYKRLHDEGLRPPQIDGSALREKQGNTKFDIETRPVTIDYDDAS
jgi:hypothetical protein